MTLIHRTGDIFATKMPAIGHGCNIDGLMGAGIAKAVRNIFPEIYPPYAVACSTKRFTVGSVLPVKTDDKRWVFNMATQDRPGRHARLEWIRESLDASVEFMTAEGIRGIALPRIGSGIGGLEWEDVLAVFEEFANENPSITFEVWSL